MQMLKKFAGWHGAIPACLSRLGSRWHIASLELILWLSVYFGFTLNLGFWRFVAQRIEITGGSMLWFAVSLVIFVFVVFVWLFSLLLVKFAGKALIIFLLLVSSAANYAMFQMGLCIDSSMIRNLFESNTREASDFVKLSAFAWVFVSGVLPALALARVRVEYRPFGRESGWRLLFFVAGVVLLAGIAATAGKEYAAFFRNHNAARKLFNTFN